jgi:hypothetical protein
LYGWIAVPLAEDFDVIRLPLVIGLVFAGFAAHARPPEDADPALSPWFEGLRQPGTGVSCCSISDCRPTDSRVVGDHYEALVGGAWRPVPPDRVLPRMDNPTGRAVVCWTPYTGIMCFIRGPEI